MFLLKITAIFGLTFGCVWGACFPGYESLGEFCYAIPHVRASWAEAEQYCQNLGGHLAVIRDATQEALVDGYIHRQHALIKTAQLWIGGTDLLQEGVFLAPVSLEPLTYFNWAPSEPDNLSGQHCLAIFRDSAQLQWDDNGCEVQNYPLCMAEQGDPVVIG
ncbi:perlucin-like [Mya arenaria]|uniref:perlucin-like n=1 Tax=Mya arenaria TaxID=6604 RepID=UPI0022E05914|nr:perlucin-like [Mya arenaria]